MGSAHLSFYVISEIPKVQTLENWGGLVTKDALATFWIVCLTSYYWVALRSGISSRVSVCYQAACVASNWRYCACSMNLERGVHDHDRWMVVGWRNVKLFAVQPSYRSQIFTDNSAWRKPVKHCCILSTSTPSVLTYSLSIVISDHQDIGVVQHKAAEWIIHSGPHTLFCSCWEKHCQIWMQQPLEMLRQLLCSRPTPEPGSSSNFQFWICFIRRQMWQWPRSPLHCISTLSPYLMVCPRYAWSLILYSFLDVQIHVLVWAVVSSYRRSPSGNLDPDIVPPLKRPSGPFFLLAFAVSLTLWRISWWPGPGRITSTCPSLPFALLLMFLLWAFETEGDWDLSDILLSWNIDELSTLQAYLLLI